MISPDEDWLQNDKCSTALYMTQFFDTFEFWMFCAPMITIIAIIYPSPSQVKGCFFLFCITPNDWRNTAHAVLSQVENTRSVFSSVG